MNGKEQSKSSMYDSMSRHNRLSHASNLKAALLKSNINPKRDLMKMYQPPKMKQNLKIDQFLPSYQNDTFDKTMGFSTVHTKATNLSTLQTHGYKHISTA